MSATWCKAVRCTCCGEIKPHRALHSTSQRNQVVILLSLHYIFFGVILAFLARDAWRYNVRRIIALREDAKTQVSMQARRECVKAQGRRQSARVLCGHSSECCTCMAWLVNSNGGRACLQDGAA